MFGFYFMYGGWPKDLSRNRVMFWYFSNILIFKYWEVIYFFCSTTVAGTILRHWYTDQSEEKQFKSWAVTSVGESRIAPLFWPNRVNVQGVNFCCCWRWRVFTGTMFSDVLPKTRYFSFNCCAWYAVCDPRLHVLILSFLRFPPLLWNYQQYFNGALACISFF